MTSKTVSRTISTTLSTELKRNSTFKSFFVNTTSFKKTNIKKTQKVLHCWKKDLCKTKGTLLLRPSYSKSSKPVCQYRSRLHAQSWPLVSSWSTFSSANGFSRKKFNLLPSLGATSFLTLFTLVCLETLLLSTVSNCAKTFYMHWNTSNSIFRIDNTDHIIDVNKGNLAFEFDQVHIICPVYEPGTYENETEKYIIYNVSKVEYETCRITNADPRVIAICDKPQKLMFFTITFRPFTPQPGGLEFLPGNDYYFISTSSKDDLYRRIGGRCSTNNMKVVFKVCCAHEEKNKTISTPTGISISKVAGSSGGIGTAAGGSSGSSVSIDNIAGEAIDSTHSTSHVYSNQSPYHNINNINTIGAVNTPMLPATGINGNGNNGIQLKSINSVGGTMAGGGSTSINTNIDQFNRIPMQTNGISVLSNNIGNVGPGVHHINGISNSIVGTSNGIMLTPGTGINSGINMIPTDGIGYPSIGVSGTIGGHMNGQSGIRINNVPSQQYHPQHKSNYNNNQNDNQYDKHPNEVVKNEELTYNSAASSLHTPSGGLIVFVYCWRSLSRSLRRLMDSNIFWNNNISEQNNQLESIRMIKQFKITTPCNTTHHDYSLGITYRLKRFKDIYCQNTLNTFNTFVFKDLIPKTKNLRFLLYKVKSCIIGSKSVLISILMLLLRFMFITCNFILRNFAMKTKTIHQSEVIYKVLTLANLWVQIPISFHSNRIAAILSTIYMQGLRAYGLLISKIQSVMHLLLNISYIFIAMLRLAKTNVNKSLNLTTVCTLCHNIINICRR